MCIGRKIFEDEIFARLIDNTREEDMLSRMGFIRM